MTQVKPVPDGYQRLISYLITDNLPRLRSFLMEAFGATEIECIYDEDKSIRHLELRIEECVLMASEAMPPQWPAKPTSYYLYVNDCDAVYQRALAAGATSLMEPANQFYGDRNAGITDPSGNQWFIATHVEDVSGEEIQRRALAENKRKKA